MALMTTAEFDQLAEDGWQEIGFCGVDHGRLLIADPSYILFKKPTDLGKDYSEFNDRYRERSLGGDQPLAAQWKFDIGHDGLGVVFDTGVGDGRYAVLAKYHDDGRWGKRISEIRMVFLLSDK